MEANPAPESETLTLDQVDRADLVIGILAEMSAEAVADFCQALRAVAGSRRIVVLHNTLQAGGPAAQPMPREGPVFLTPWPLVDQNLAGTPAQSVLASYDLLFATAEKLAALGCCAVASKLEAGPPAWVCELAEPFLEGKFDFVAPCYARRKFEGLLNNCIISPLMRSLFGKRIQNPMGPDFGISQRLYRRLITNSQNGKPNAGGIQLLASFVPRALCDNLPVCQVYVGSRIYPPMEWTNVSSLLTEILGPVFHIMETQAACWQKVRTSAPVAALNSSMSFPQSSGAVDIGRMVESFQLGNRDLQEIWRLVLPPGTLIELNKLSRLPPGQFQFPDKLWVRIIYDFAIAYRLRTINRDHLLRSLTPLFLGWVASYARDLEAAEEARIEDRLERLSLAYEEVKPYLVSRWRWPDSFNP